MSGRRPIEGKRFKPNGLSEELDDWFKAEAERRSTPGNKITGAGLKRLALREFQTAVERARLSNGSQIGSLNPSIAIGTDASPAAQAAEDSHDGATGQ